MRLMEIINTTSNFLNTYPICPPILMAMLTCGLIPILLLIYLIQKTAVHSFELLSSHETAIIQKMGSVVRYLITMWCVSFCGMFASYYGIVMLNIVSDKGYFPSSMFEPGTLLNLLYVLIKCLKLLVSNCTQFMHCSFFVVRDLSPMQYYDRSFAVIPQLLVTILIIIISVSHCIFVYGESDDHKSIASAVFVVLDTGTVWLNFYAVRYCNRRYEELYGKAELNARYQVKEAHTMAVAMKPVYIASYVIKFSVNFTCIFFFMFEAVFTSVTGYIEVFYICVMSVNGGLTSALLIRNHPRINQRFVEAKNNIFCMQNISRDTRCFSRYRHSERRQYVFLDARCREREFNMGQMTLRLTEIMGTPSYRVLNAVLNKINDDWDFDRNDRNEYRRFRFLQPAVSKVQRQVSTPTRRLCRSPLWRCHMHQLRQLSINVSYICTISTEYVRLFEQESRDCLIFLETPFSLFRMRPHCVHGLRDSDNGANDEPTTMSILYNSRFLPERGRECRHPTSWFY
ncbi:hypothetical protein PRIPAC_89939, partial [Pristionchus pacificus]|uniref:Uncharacterized protein n=1 Tax=Pristionchus pacificus TaxID=54126 RepID=A0A2A6CXY5_PRIPA